MLRILSIHSQIQDVFFACEAPKEAKKKEHSKEDVAAVAQSLYNAIQANDVAKLESLADDNVIWGHTGGELDNKAAYIKTNSNKDYNYTSIKPSEENIRIYGDVAFVRHTVDGVFKENDSIDALVKVKMVTAWHYNGDSWKLVDRQGALISEEKVKRTAE